MAVNDAFGRTRSGRPNGRWKLAPDAEVDARIRAEMQEQADLLALSTELGANETILDLTKH